MQRSIDEKLCKFSALLWTTARANILIGKEEDDHSVSICGAQELTWIRTTLKPALVANKKGKEPKRRRESSKLVQKRKRKEIDRERGGLVLGTATSPTAAASSRKERRAIKRAVVRFK